MSSKSKQPRHSDSVAAQQPVFTLIQFKIEQKQKAIAVQDIKGIQHINDLTQSAHLNLYIKRSGSGLSRLVRCASCKEWLEWSAADEECIQDTGGGTEGHAFLKRCRCAHAAVHVWVCKCCPFFYYRKPKDFNTYTKSHHCDKEEAHCWGQAEGEKSMTWRQLRDCLPEKYRRKPLTVVVDWLFSEADSLQGKEQQVFANDVIWSVPIRDRSNAQCTLVEVLHQVLKQRAATASKVGSLRRATIPHQSRNWIPKECIDRPGLYAELRERVLGASQQGGGESACMVGARGGNRAGTTSAQGMGGVGKTTMAALLLSDPQVGVTFERLLWLSVSQRPDILSLLRDLHFQLTSSQMPRDIDTEDQGAQVLREAARGKKVLLVLDDCWHDTHAKILNCMDEWTGSHCVITTRIRNLSGDRAREIVCGLLSQEESLSLLLKSAGGSCDEAAAAAAAGCCGGLALALKIAGGMIRIRRDDWQETLLPRLKGALSQDSYVAKSIVDASLSYMEDSEEGGRQGRGAQALFLCFGCFAEHAVVPAGVLDLLQPVVSEMAACKPKDEALSDDGSSTQAAPEAAAASSKSCCCACGGPGQAVGPPTCACTDATGSLREWLDLLLRANLLSGSVDDGVSAHGDCPAVRNPGIVCSTPAPVQGQPHSLTLCVAPYLQISCATSW